MMRAPAILLAIAAGTAQAAETPLLPDPDAPARLVLPHWPVGGWVVRQTGAEVEIRFPRATLDIDTSGAAAPGIPVSGITARQQGTDTVLSLTLACACAVAISGDGDSRLAIDIVGAGLPAGPVLRASGPAPAMAPLPRRRGAVTGTVAGSAAPRPDAPPELVVARDRLIRQLEKAAAAGLIEMDRPLGTTAAPPNEEGSAGGTVTPVGLEAVPDPLRTGPPRRPTPGAGERDRGTAVSGAVDGALPSALPAEAPAARLPVSPTLSPGLRPAAPRCLAEDALAAMEDPPAEPALAEIGRLRGMLAGEFDRPDADAALALARQYVRLGMGAEAVAVLEAFPVEGSEAEATAAVAGVLAQEAPVLPPALARAGCGGRHALWAAFALALAGDPAAALDRAAEAETVLADLAPPLRRQMAAEFGLAAVRLGRPDAARRYHALARRGEPAASSPPRRRLLEARLAAIDGRFADAAAIHRGLWGGAGAEAVAGMTALANLVADGALAGPHDTQALRLDLGAAAHRLRGTAAGAAALVAEARLTASALGLAAALDRLADGLAAGTLDRKAHAEAVADLSAVAGGEGEAEPLALLAERRPDAFAGAADDPAFRVALARSWIGLGMPERADAALVPGDAEDPALAADLADAYLAAGSPEEALRHASALPEGDTRAALEARALDALGRAEAALARLPGTESADAARIAWEAGDWAAAAAALETAGADDPATAAKLAAARARLAKAPSDPPAPEDVADYLETLRQETDMLRKALSDG